MAIKNIVFDLGNVLVRWDPLAIVVNTFPDRIDSAFLAKSIFTHSIWLDLNLGLMTEDEAIVRYQAQWVAYADHFSFMMKNVRDSLQPLEESVALLRRLDAHYPLYALTDNTKEIMTYLKETYDFFSIFKGIVVSADIGHLKPSAAIYHYLLTTYDLRPEETLFIDDRLVNVIGARNRGMKAIHFRHYEQCRAELRQWGIVL